MSDIPWNSLGPFTCHCDSCDAKPEPACKVCGADCIPLNDLDECATCQPREDETCEEYEARVRTIRSGK